MYAKAWSVMISVTRRAAGPLVKSDLVRGGVRGGARGGARVVGLGLEGGA